MVARVRAPAIDPGRIVFEQHDPAEAPRRESLLGLGNGVLFARASDPEAAFAAPGDARRYPGLYLAGFYNRAEREINSERVTISSLARLPDPFGLGLRIDGDAAWFSLDPPNELLKFRHELDMRDGVARRTATVRDTAGRTTRLEELRCVSMARADTALLQWRITPLDWTGSVTAASRLATSARNAKLERTRAYEGRHLDVRAVPIATGAAVRMRTRDGARQARIESRLRCGGEVNSTWLDEQGDAVVQQCTVAARAGQPFELAVLVRVFEEPRHETPSEDASIDDPPIDTLLAEHRAAWAALWPAACVRSGCDPTLQRGAAFNAFHLLQTASPLSASKDTGLPARGWQEGYFGHVFWDELFAFPFFNLRWPVIARSLLLYRFRRLDAARQAARRAGLRGAMFPWRSTDTGGEETPAWQWIPTARCWKRDHTHLQHHVGAAIAHEVWQHALTSADGGLLDAQGGELMVEIARFWASIATPGRNGRLEIRGVVGPDEYHDAFPGAARPGLDNNAYTNLMAAWALRCAAALPVHLGGERWHRLVRLCSVSDEEVADWYSASRRLFVGRLPGDVLSQFDGFDRLEPADSPRLAPLRAAERTDWQLAARGDDVNRYQRNKQADVLMLLHLLGHDGAAELMTHLGYALSDGWQERTVRHYMARIDGHSSLSAIACAGALAEIAPDESWSHFRRSLHIDHGGSPSPSSHEGLHLGAMAGSWDLLQRVYLGLRPSVHGLDLRPALPSACDDLQMRIQLRGQWLSVWLKGTRLTVLHRGAEPGVQSAPLDVRYRGQAQSLRPGAEVSLVVR
jgi:trehalose/maltose hydrolase-like predicted phosphorylase